MKLRLLIICFCFARGAAAQLTYQNLEVLYDSAIEYRNLKIIPIVEKERGTAPAPQMLSLGRAIQKGLVTVTERGTASTENVHWLRINNKSRIPLFIAGGELMLGGRQDRMVTRDTVLIPNGRDQYVSVMCVEEGRWSNKEKKLSYFNYANPRLRKVAGQSANQVLIWREIFNQLDSNKIKSPTQSYLHQRIDKKMIALQEEYLRFFLQRIQRTDSTWVGFVCTSGAKIIGCDVFAGNSLFYDQLEPLLPGYIEDAIIKGSPSQVSDERVKKYLDPILTSEESQEQYLKTKGKIYKYQGKTIHLTAFSE